MVAGRSSYFESVMVAVIVLAFAGLPAAPLFVAVSVPPAKIEEVMVPSTHPLDASAVDLTRYAYQEQEYYVSGTANR
jgi:hypothetical protein